MKPDGLFYLTLPNIASLENRMKLLQGKSIHDPIEAFFTNLSPHNHDIVGLHWREYTADETKEMLERMDFEVIKQEYGTFYSKSNASKISSKRVIKKLISIILNLKPVKRAIYSCIFDPDLDPSLKETQVIFALKTNDCHRKFHFTDATLPK